MQKRKLVFAVVVLCLLIGAAIAVYWYQKPRTKLSKIEPAYTLTAKELFSAFNDDEEKANDRYVEKVILVKGKVERIEKGDNAVSILLSSGDEMGGINVNVPLNIKDRHIIPGEGDLVKVKGRCVGYLIDVNLVDGIIEP